MFVSPLLDIVGSMTEVVPDVPTSFLLPPPGGSSNPP